MSWFRKGYTTKALNAEQLDVVIQKLAKMREMWLNFGAYPDFSVSVHQYYYDTDPGIQWSASYKIHFSHSAWKKLNRKLSNQEMMANLLGTEEGE